MRTLHAKGKQLLAGMLILSLIGPFLSVTLYPQKAYAIPVEITSNTSPTDITTSIKTTISAAADLITSESGLAIKIKEYVLDPLAWALGRQLIRSISSSIINWINGGFNGNPAFVTDLGGFLRDVADRTAGDFIQNELGLGFICSPFQLDVQVAIALSYYSEYSDRQQCTLSGVVENIENFVAGEFSEGGWAGWLALTTNPHNNPYGEFVEAQAELRVRVSNAQGEEFALLDFGRGFLSWEECVQYEGESPNQNRTNFDGPDTDLLGNPVERANRPAQTVPAIGAAAEPTCVKSEIVTPGSAIEGQLEQVLGSDLDKLEIADEIDEILGALAAALMQQALGGIGGLLGASRSSSSQFDGRSLTQQLIAQQDTNELTELKTRSLEEIRNARQVESNYNAAKQTSFASVLDAESRLQTLQGCYQDKISTGSLTPSNRQLAQSRIALASSTIASQITPRKAALESDVQESALIIEQLDATRDAVTRAQNTNALNTIMQAFVELRSPTNEADRVMHTLADVVEAQQEQSTIQTQMANLNAQTQQDIIECQGFPNNVNISNDV